MQYTFELLEEIHRQAVIDIFNYFIENDFAAFPDTKIPYAMFDKFLQISQHFPFLVVKTESGEVIGFGFIHPHLPHATIRRTVEITYFILPEHTHKGLGTQLMNRLLEGAHELGVDNVLASISSLNTQSILFHKKHGFQECGRFTKVGRKFDQDFDIIWMQKII